MIHRKEEFLEKLRSVVDEFNGGFIIGAIIILVYIGIVLFVGYLLIVTAVKHAIEESSDTIERIIKKAIMESKKEE